MHHSIVQFCEDQTKEDSFGMRPEEVKMFVCLYWFELMGARVPFFRIVSTASSFFLFLEKQTLNDFCLLLWDVVQFIK